jgi:hypothetical protein
MIFPPGYYLLNNLKAAVPTTAPKAAMAKKAIHRDGGLSARRVLLEERSAAWSFYWPLMPSILALKHSETIQTYNRCMHCMQLYANVKYESAFAHSSSMDACIEVSPSQVLAPDPRARANQ